MQFFRRMPSALLARYFREKHGVLSDIAFDMLKETEVEPIFEGFMGLPDDKQVQIEAECQDFDAMACQGGLRALANEADFHQDAAFPAAVSEIDGFHGAVMWAFLEHPRYWAGATLFLQADKISESLWKKRNDLSHVAPSMWGAKTLSVLQKPLANISILRKAGAAFSCGFRWGNKSLHHYGRALALGVTHPACTVGD